MREGRLKGIHGASNAIWYDLRQGILKRYYVYLIAAVPFIMLSLQAVQTIEFIGEKVTFLNILIVMFKGCMEFLGQDNNFRIPLEYMTIIIMCSLIHGWYVKNEFRGRGTLVVLRMKNMSYWWLGKCVWGVSSVALYMITLYICVFFINILWGDGSIGWTEGINNIMESPITAADNKDIVMYTVLLPCVTLIAITGLQIFIQLLASPMAAMVVNIIIMVTSAFEFKWYAIGNNFMLLRSKLVREDGAELKFSLIISMAVFILTAVLGKRYTERKELL